MLDKIVMEMAHLKEVEAIALGGSRATKNHDELSDYDVYIYVNDHLSEDKRRQILDKYCRYMEYSNHYWELEDDGILNNGVEIELIYRDLSFLRTQMHNLFVDKAVGNGYSTCFYSNLMESKILYDPNKYLEGLQVQYKDAYSEDLKKAIVQKNALLLVDAMPSLYGQVKKAILRQDTLAIIHRVATYMEIYFDVLFALNKTPHPGEKRMLDYGLMQPIKPSSYERNMRLIVENISGDHEILLQALEQASLEMLVLIKQHI